MPSPQEFDRRAFDHYVTELRDMDEGRLSREVSRMTLVCLTERDDYDVKNRHWQACLEAARAFPGLVERSMPWRRAESFA